MARRRLPGKLMGLNEEQLANALGQARDACRSGTMEATKSGQRAKCVQVGNAAYNGILAACLAQTGMEGCLTALEGPNGLFATQSENVESRMSAVTLARSTPSAIPITRCIPPAAMPSRALKRRSTLA